MRKLHWSAWGVAAVVCVCSGVACSSSDSGSSSAGSTATSKAGGDTGEGVKLQGTGATFPAPLYGKWFKAYGLAHPGVQINYQAVGSGAGVKAVKDKTVDFGASDAAMTEEEMKAVEGGVQLLPMTAGSIVLAYNLEGVDDLKLTREAYVDIFLGKITKWNDPKIAAANPGVQLPDANVNVIVRADGSGTTFVFTQHLSTISEEFKKSPGTDKQPNWPVGTKSKGNDGVAASIKTTPGAIGYIEFAHATFTKLPMALLQNKAGKFIKPTIASGQASLASVTLPENLIAWLPDPAGNDSYPIVTYTWIICYKHYAEAQKAATLKDVLAYGLTDGQKDSEALGFIPLPADVAVKVMAALGNIK
jgi:phosphate transport system substrate-binding protein